VTVSNSNDKEEVHFLALKHFLISVNKVTTNRIAYFNPENWNLLSFIYENNQLYLQLQTSLSSTQLAIEIDRIRFPALISENFSVQIQIGSLGFDIPPTRSHIAKSFLERSHLPFVLLNDLFFDSATEFADSHPALPDFINESFKRPSNKFAVENEAPPNQKKNREVIVSNDYYKNYKDDASLQVNFEESGIKYRFNHLMNISILNYFTHHFLTIPTLAYIKAAHSTGNKIIGTLIVEDHSHLYDTMVLEVDQHDPPFIQRMIDELKSKGFDGYLLNFEQSCQQNQIKGIVKWVQLLYKKIKEANPDYLIVWYDSLNVEGEVSWQGEVNSLNKVFADETDFFFLDYRWTSEKIQASISQIDRPEKIAGGIDIYGRGSVKGKFETSESAKKLKELGVSVALFAPGFTVERNDGELSLDTHLINEQRLWMKAIPKVVLDQTTEKQSPQSVSINFLETIAPGLSTFDIYFSIQVSRPVLSSFDKYSLVILFKNGSSIVACSNNFDKRFSFNTPSQKNCEKLISDPKKSQFRVCDHSPCNELIFVEKEKFFNFQKEIKTIEIHVLSDRYKTADKFDINQASFIISKLTIYEMKYEKNSLIEQMRSKKVVSLPINTFFNEANCDFIHFKGKRTFMQNYNYLFDYDINTDFSGKQIPLTDMGIKSPSLLADVNIDRNVGFFGCSSLRISAILDHKTVS